MANQIIVTIKELSSELFIQPKSLRKKLRDNNIPKPGTRWEWPENHETVRIIRSWKDKPQEDENDELLKTIEEDIEMEISMDDELEAFGEEEVDPQVIYTKETKSGIWKILTGPEGVKAIYAGENSSDATKWMTQESDIRKTLPKYIKEEIMKAL